MKTYDILLGMDENYILQYLQNYPHSYITEMEVARRAGGRNYFLNDSHWAHNPLCILVDLGLLETDGQGKYRIKSDEVEAPHSAAKFISPQFRHILEHSGRKFDLTAYAQ